MTVLDTSVAHIPVLMVLGDHEPPADGPRCRRAIASRPGSRASASRGCGCTFFSASCRPSMRGSPTFERTYEADPAALERQMILVVDEKGELAGTSSLWRGDHFGEPRLRVHWVGVDPAHQRRGLAQ